MRCIYGLFQLVSFSIFRLFKKVFVAITFPFVYPFLHSIYQAKNAYTQYNWNIDEVLKHNKGWKLFVWFYFDDSIYSDYGLNYDPKEHKSKLVTILCKILPFACNFLMTWYWCGFRNTANNFAHYLSYKFVGKFISVCKSCKKTNKLRYEIRRFQKAKLPYLEYKISDKKAVNVGWLHSGKFEGPKVSKL